MTTVVIVTGAFAWWMWGVTGFAYWWTTEYDLRTPEVFVAIFAGILGPFAWLVGRAIHGASRKPPRVWIPKK